MSRVRVRTWLIGGMALVVLITGGFAAWIAVSFVQAKVDTVGKVDFDRPLAIPPLADSTIRDGTRVFDLTMQTGRTDLGRGEPTETWGVNGSYLGPTLRAERGEQVRIDVRNALPEASTLHWHGMHLPAAMDGGPHQMIEPDRTWSPTWRVDQPAATLWYHPHPHGRTAEHVYRGIAGMFWIDDREAAPDLPSEYGVDDVPVIVEDKRFDGSQLSRSRSLLNNTGVLGEEVLVNGTPGPYLEVGTELVRLRLLNASGARIYRFHLVDGDGEDLVYRLIGTDGGLLPAPVELTHLELSPGERAEIVVALPAGEHAVLRSAPLEDGNRFAGGDDSLDVLELRAADRLAPSSDLPDELAPAPDLRLEDVSRTRDFRLADTSINGRSMAMNRIDETVELGATELWRVRTADSGPHNFHIHDVQFQVHRVNGAAPPPELRGWKDTINLPAGREVELLLRFTDYADPATPYMYHCHLLRHEDQGMMGQFVVVEPGHGEVSRLDVPDPDHAHH